MLRPSFPIFQCLITVSAIIMQRVAQCAKTRNLLLFMKYFVKTAQNVILELNALISRNFCVKVNFCNFHTVAWIELTFGWISCHMTKVFQTGFCQEHIVHDNTTFLGERARRLESRTVHIICAILKNVPQLVNNKNGVLLWGKPKCIFFLFHLDFYQNTCIMLTVPFVCDLINLTCISYSKSGGDFPKSVQFLWLLVKRQCFFIFFYSI